MSVYVKPLGSVFLVLERSMTILFLTFYSFMVIIPMPCCFLADSAAQLPSSEGQLASSCPSVLQIALAASLASLSAAALAEEVGDELGMLWPTRVLPALLRALPYLSLYTDRYTSLCNKHAHCHKSPYDILSVVTSELKVKLRHAAKALPQPAKPSQPAKPASRTAKAASQASQLSCCP